ncbi:MAG: glutamate--tRNA ligase [Chloroflexi bacterium]|nr:MAG: glutamate--tRNA ligase [Chloroflexota bacterium]
MTTVRVRFAPSPTGWLHVGNARTALFDWLYARHTGGVFILRIEDTDRKRLVPGALEDIKSQLLWLGLDWDEGPDVGGEYGPYVQSERLDIYHKYAEQLLQSGHAYKCYCSPERLEQVRREKQARGEAPGYDRHCRNLTDEERAACEAEGITPVIRLKMPLEGEITFADVIRGEITFDFANLEDIVLMKSDGFPTYHFANVVDDHLMRVTHIMRGDEWISSVPPHLVMYKAFGWEPPVFAHLPMILDPSGEGKLSKRKGSDQMTEIREFRAAGYLPEALFNFLALLGWAYSGDQDIFTREQAIERFDIADVRPAPSVFSYDKLRWMNGVYIRQLPVDELANRLTSFLQEKGLDVDPGFMRRVTPLIQERIHTLGEAIDWIDFFFQDEVHPDPADLPGKKMDVAQTAEALAAAHAVLSSIEPFERAAIEPALRGKAEELGLKVGQFLTPIRVAVTGKRVAPPLFGTLEILGKEKVLQRLEAAHQLLLHPATPDQG